MKTAFICGISGQTGSYLARRLLEQDVRVIGTSRDRSEANLWRLKRLNALENVELVSLSLHDQVAIRRTLSTYEPDVIYYLAGPSSVAASFREPMVTMDQIFQPVVAFLEVLKESQSPAHFFNAASTDCFGNQPGVRLNEDSALQPLSPYGVAKAAAFSTVRNYRTSFGVNASNGILTNHESPLRGAGFVTQKIINGLLDIRSGKANILSLGSTTISRDWLWAGDVARAITGIAEASEAGDYVIASGRSATLQEFVNLACDGLGLDPAEVISREESLVRPSEIQEISLNPERANRELGWKADYTLEDIVSALLHGDAGPQIPTSRKP